MTAFLCRYCPPFIIDAYTRYIRRVGYFGNYNSWSDAVGNSNGYDDDSILQKIKAATQAVMDGRACAERDSCTFEYPIRSWPMLSALLLAAAHKNNRLRILDFGGSLGSVFFQHRDLLAGLDELKWCVVEQAHVVNCGQVNFSDDCLSFYHGIEECLAEGAVDLVLLSSVLPYMEKPYELIREVVEARPDYIVIDRTPVISGVHDRLTVQRVDPRVYEGSYPAWMLSQEKLLSILKASYSLEFEFDALAGEIPLGNTTAFDKGFVFRLKGEEDV